MVVKTKQDNFDWIKEMSIQRKTLFSNSIMIETDDARRVEELLDAMPPLAKQRRGGEKWLVLDGWEGLSEATSTENNQHSRTPIEGIDVQSYGIGQVLPDISKMLYQGKTVLVITNVFRSDPKLDAAIRGWSTSEIIRERDSTVVVFADDRSIYPVEVWAHMKIIKPPKSTWDERVGLLNYHQLELSPSEQLDAIRLEDATRLTSGMNLDQLESAAIESRILTGKISLEVLAKAKKEILAKNPVVEIIQQPKFGFEAVGGYDTLKERITDSIVLPMKNPELSARFDISPPRGILLFGPPGTGKTLLVKSMAKELNMSIIRILPENIKGKYVGESEKSMRKVFDIADAMSPCIVFVDELDRLSKRGNGHQTSSAVERELFSMLLEKLGDEERQWFFAGATNLIESIDPAMRRTGRIDSVAPVPYPDEKAREEIFNIHTKVRRKLPLAENIDVEKIAEATHMWSGSDIEQLVVRTAHHVMKESVKTKDKSRVISMNDFEQILDTFNIDVKENKKIQKDIENQALKYTNDKRLKDVFEHAAKLKTSGKIDKAKEILKEMQEEGGKR